MHTFSEAICCAWCTTGLHSAGHERCHQALKGCKAISFYAKATIYRNGQKMFAVTPRGEQECGSGVHVHVRSSGNAFSHAELVALIKYTSPASQRIYVAAVVHLLQKVPGSQCVVRLGENTSNSLTEGEQVVLLGRATLEGDPHTVSVRKCAAPRLRYEIMSNQLQPVTAARQPGTHAFMTHAGDYVQYGHDAKTDCCIEGYTILDEYEAVDPSNGIKVQVSLVPDSGGKDTKGRPRFFWNKNLDHH